MPESRRNWPLIAGGALVLAVILAAAAGPLLAPHDPLQNYFIIQVGSRWVRAPFPAFAVPDFLLGTDRFGRDVWSRLLYAVRPTLALVGLAALVRLALGLVLGVVSGWSAGRLGRWLDLLISACLAVPVMIVALAVIALAGHTIGAWAFVIGLALTGWAEVARILREETRAVKGQQYIEAARALGQSGLALVFRHVLRQVSPLFWMVLPLEIGSALLALASLGFLGYYAGGDVWVMVSEFVASRATGMPDLGEMLATSATVLDTQPWSMLAAGSAVFIIILGFNLLGDGLRAQIERDVRRRKSLYATVNALIGERIEASVLAPLSNRWQRRRFRAGLAAAGAALLAVAVAVVVWQAQSNQPAFVTVPVPGGHLWGSEQRDPQLSLTADTIGPEAPAVLWTFHAGSGFSGGPAVSRDRMLYAASLSQTLYALDATGQAVWTATLPARPAAGPALGVTGTIYVADTAGGLSAIAPGGAFAWHFALDNPAAPIAGPIVITGATGESVVYPVEGYLVAVRPDGRLKWRAPIPYSFLNPAARASPAGDVVFFMDVVVDADNGRVLVKETPNPLDLFVTTADGRTFKIGDRNLMEWRATDQGAAIVELAPLNYTQQYPGSASAAGTLPRRQLLWVYFGNEYQQARVIWLDMDGRVVGSSLNPLRPARLAGIDRNATIYVCGTNEGAGQPGALCSALAPGVAEPIWTLALPHSEVIQGGALVDGRLYLSTGDGALVAIGNAPR